MKLAIHPFIFNWKRQFEKSCRIEDELKQIFGRVTVINSDDDNTREGWIDIGDGCYFGEQFRRAVELFEGDILFHVQGDVEYDTWSKLVEDAKFYLRFYEAGIYAPNVDYCWWSSEKTDINGRQLEHKNLKLVASTDETVWFIRKEVIQGIKERKIDMTMNPLGWGWDCVLSAISYAKGMPVIRDYRHTIKHPYGMGYDFDAATKGMDELVASLDEDLRIIYGHIRGEREQLLRFLDGTAVTPRYLGTREGYENGLIASKRLAEFYDLSKYLTFVETGTFLGDGVAWALEQGFKEIYSIEVSKDIYEKARDRFKEYSNVTILHGDSVEVLAGLMKELHGPVFFYLDAHWSGNHKNIQTGSAGDNVVPLKEESTVLVSYKDLSSSLLVIDDERLMVDPPNPPGNWGAAVKRWLLEFWCSQYGYSATYLDDSLVFEKRAKP